MKSLLCIGMPHAFIVAYSMTGSAEARQTAAFVSGTVARQHKVPTNRQPK